MFYQDPKIIMRLKQFLSGGVHYNFRTVGEEVPRHIKSGKGSMLWDLDNNKYLDFYCKFGAMILGHNHPEYNESLKKQINRLIAVNHTDLDLEVTELVAGSIPGIEKVRFGLSGTEIIQNALRLARAYTKKNKFLRFEGWVKMRGKVLLTIALILFVFSTAGYAEIDGNEILIKSDQKLIPHTCSYKLQIITTDERGKTTESLFEGYKKGNARNVMIVKNPKRLAGSVHLRKDEVIWSYYTTNHRLMKVAYQSIFMGSLLNYGDVLGTELSFDYHVVETEVTEESYILTLNPLEGQSGYAKVKVYIDIKTMLPQKREYYAVSEILMKECEFKMIQMEAGALQRMEQVFYEPLKDKESVALYEEIQILDNIPDTYFNEHNLKFFGGE